MRNEGAYQLSPMDLSDFHHQPGGRRGLDRVTLRLCPSLACVASVSIPFFFCSLPNFLDELARKRLLRRLVPVNTFRGLFRATDTCDVFTFDKDG